VDLTLEALESPPVLETPSDLAHLDHVVRTDCNTFALHLATSVSSLQQKVANFDVVRDAHAVDLKLVALRGSIVLAEERHKALRETIFATAAAHGLSAESQCSLTATSRCPGNVAMLVPLWLSFCHLS
jgi:hypothetical protein